MKNPFDTSINVNVDERTKPRTSALWLLHENFIHITVLEATGWDKTKFNYSFSEEPITSDEFITRCMNSTCSFKDEFERHVVSKDGLHYRR